MPADAQQIERRLEQDGDYEGDQTDQCLNDQHQSERLAGLFTPHVDAGHIDRRAVRVGDIHRTEAGLLRERQPGLGEIDVGATLAGPATTNPGVVVLQCQLQAIPALGEGRPCAELSVTPLAGVALTLGSPVRETRIRAGPTFLSICIRFMGSILLQ